MHEDERDPHKFLEAAMQEEKKKKKGKLKIFFGYAAGTGKTYAMLSDAHDAQKDGIDVVVGYIEPHARPDTMALLTGLEVLPPLEVAYHGVTLKEFDLDKALERKPKLILVDEFAHTNANTCRHAKRYQDVQELLNAGIDVYTTVNVQHLESLNDVVAQITGIIVRERIPDSVFDDNSQVELVDIDPDDLLERLKQGKIYREKQANKALGNFFTVENLISLREIALRRMADHINSLQLQADREKSLTSVVTAEHILICLSSSPSNPKVIRQAARMAAAFHAKFTAIYVETPDFNNMLQKDKERLQNNTRLARELGANTVTSYGSDIVEQIAEYAKVARVSKIVLGRSYTKRKLFSVQESFSERLTDLSPQLEIFLIPDNYDKKYVKPIGLQRYTQDYSDSMWMFGVLSVSTIFGYMLSHWNFGDVSIVASYIIGVFFTTFITKGKIYGIIASFLSVLLFNFCFTRPVYTFEIVDIRHIILFVVMFIIAMICAGLTHKVKEYAKLSAQKAYRLEILLATSRKLQKAADKYEIVEQTVAQLGTLLEKNIYFYLGNPRLNPLPFTYICNEALQNNFDNQRWVAVAEWTFKNNRHAGFSTTTLPGEKCLYLAIRNGEKVFGVVAIDMENQRIPAYEEGIMVAILNECAFALEKDELLKDQENASLQLKQEQLRANLLRSISHDLRTPLTCISGNAEVLLHNLNQMKQEKAQKLCEDIYDESIWLINLVENLLSVTRIENGTMKLQLNIESLSDIVDEALKHIKRKLNHHPIYVEHENDLLMVKADGRMIIQVITNIVDNALKYTPQGTQVTITTRQVNDEAIVQIADDGLGITDEAKSKLFDMFYSAKTNAADGKRGMGLGLALCKSIINAHGGELTVADNKPQGTIFQFNLKVEEVRL
ncbi:ATP-binding protein [Anaerosinus sp.]